VHQAVDLCLQSAAGLQAAHKVGFVHGDLSPLTILVTQAPGGDPRVKLIRFPLRQQGAERPIDKEVNPDYASPERLAGRIPDERSDVFSLGAVLHRLLAGAPPGFGSVERSIPEAMRAVVSQALAPAPAQRFQTISEFATAVERAAAVAGKARKPRVGRARALGAAGAALVVVAMGLWLLGSSRWPVRGAALRVSEAHTRAPASAALPARPVPAPQAPAAPLRATKPVPAPPAARQEALAAESIRAAAAAATAKLDEERRSDQATKPEPPLVSGYVAADGPAPPTLEERARVYLRIGLDEASRQLGGPVHAIEGMSPMFIGLAQGQLSAGGDTSQPMVRAAYLDPNGRLILLDQQRIRPGQSVPATTLDRWAIGNVMVSLHGEASPKTISNLRARVR
jgi:Protein kinase domain